MKQKPLCAFFLLLLFLGPGGCAQQRRHPFMRAEAVKITKEHYRIFDSAGNPADMESILRAARHCQVIFIGESHGDPVAHFMEAEILQQAFWLCREKEEQAGKKNRPLRLSAEMFEQDTQPLLDEYLSGMITEKHFLDDARPWHNYPRDYRPLVEFAKEKAFPVIAANAPGRYVNRVSRLGPASLSALSPLAKSWLPPLPYARASDAYREKFRKFWENNEKKRAEMRKKGHKMPQSHAPGSQTESHETAPDRELQFENLLAAQSLWDAGMAHAIAEELKKKPEALIVHVNGQFHSAEGLGIPEHLVRYRPGTKFLTVTVLPVTDFPDFPEEAKSAGDFIILSNPALLRSVTGM
ncbi:MAG: ChaN family lipoprotein [Desulfococcaceae bacterium]|jgi:uncharacterized iron-regulated protein|nr:ChaN family lipoprotein [Desulfococcaceae bacterium]